MSQQRPRQFAYDGIEGQTRREPVHVPRSDGTLETAEVYRVVNVATDPRLRARALDGSLHRLPTGTELACSFVYHDPAELRFVLVVPAALAHRVLAERAELLRRLADDTRHRVPPYVARADVVVGADGLRAWLEAPTEDEALAVHERLAKRETALSAREAELADRSAAMTSEDDRLRLEQERLDALRRELELKERELEARVATLREREAELAAAAEGAAAMVGAPGAASEVDLAAEVQMLDEPALTEAVEVIEEAGFEDVEALETVDAEALDVDELEEVDLEEVSEPQPTDEDGVAELAAAVELLDTPDAEDVLAQEVVEDGAEPTMIRESEAPRAMGRRLGTAPTPPSRFFTDSQVEMVAEASAEEVWLFARLGPGHEQDFQGDDTELLAQYLVVESYPVVLLSLVDWRPRRPYVRRAALDPRADADRALLERLKDDLSVRVALFGPEGRYERTLEVSAPERQPNLALILDRAARAEGRGDAATALERALAAPPPVRHSGQPFGPAEPAANAAEALARVEALAAWSAPARLDMALLALSIPRGVVDARFREILTDAVAYGIALPPPLVSRAVSLGVAAEPGELVARLVAAFDETSRRADAGGLEEDVVARNWERLLEAAEEHEVALASDVHERAWALLAKTRGAAELVAADLSSIPERPSDELRALLDHPRVRRAAALELLSRGDVELLPAVAQAMRKMSPPEVLDLTPRIVKFGEAAGDALIDALEARPPFVRHAAALALGELQLRRSIAPLVHQLQSEPGELWRELARLVGSFGSGALRSLTRAMRDPKGQEDRLAYALAHVARRSPKKVEALRNDERESVRRIAEAMLTLGEEAERHARAVQDGTTEPEDPTLAFAWGFYRALAPAQG